jgi:hypothetical protein
MASTHTDRRQGFSSALAQKAPCRLATTANITLSGYQTIDGVLPTSSDPVWMRRILVKDQTDASQNGIWIMDNGPWIRAKDFDGNAGRDFIKGTRVNVVEGATQAGIYIVNSAVLADFESDDDDITFGALLNLTEALTITAPASGLSPLTLAEASSAAVQTAPLLAFGLTQGTFYQRPASRSENDVPWTQVVRPVDYTSYYNEVVTVGWNLRTDGYIEPSVIGKATLTDTWEYKYEVVPGRYFVERHMESIDESGVNHRIFSFAAPHDGGLGSSGAIVLDGFVFYNYGFGTSNVATIALDLINNPGIIVRYYPDSDKAFQIRLAGGSKELFQIGGGVSGTTLDEIQIGTDIVASGNNAHLLIAASAFTFAKGSVKSTHATGGLGYGTGAGGAVTQGTSKATGVELNKVCGQITTHNATLNAGAEVGFTVTNSAVAATDVVVACIASGATADSYHVEVDAVGAGSFRLSLTNVSASNLSEAIVINFVVVKAVAS